MLKEQRSARNKVINTMTYATHILAHMRNYTSAYAAVLDDPIAIQIAQAELSPAQLAVLSDMRTWIIAHRGTLEAYLTALEIDIGEGSPGV